MLCRVNLTGVCRLFFKSVLDKSVHTFYNETYEEITKKSECSLRRNIMKEETI